MILNIYNVAINFSKDLKVTVCYKGVANYHNTISVKISEIGKLN